jgi:hypothetical protein
MAFATTVTMPNDGTYRLHPNLKKYTLGDLGFVTNPAGVHVLHRALEPDKALANAIQLKMSVNKDLNAFKLSTVSAGDVVRVDIFRHPNQEQLVEMYRHYIDNLVEREVLQRIED